MKRLLIALLSTAVLFACDPPVPCATCGVDSGSGGGGGEPTGGGTAMTGGGGGGGSATGGGGGGGDDAGVEEPDAGIDAGAVIVSLIPSASTLAVVEGASATLTLTLSEQPAADVTVQLSSSDAAAATVSPATLSFTSTNWNVAQTLTVTGVDDLDLVDEAVTLTLSSTSATGDEVVAITVTDDDQLSVLISPAALSVNEGATATATVTLSNPPTNDTAVTVSSSLPGLATALPAVLVFTTANYATPQTLTINGLNDANTVDDVATITASATGATAATLTVTVNDDDQLGLELLITTLTMPEYASRTLLVNLTSQPPADVTVNVVSSDPGALTALPATLTFTPTNWNVAQNIAVDGVQDPDATDEVVTVTVSATGLTPRTATVTVTDDDIQRILTSTMAVTAAEGGTATFGVRLQAQPVTPVTVNISSGDPAIATAAPATLTFTAANYTVNQTVTVTGGQDINVADDFAQLSLSSAAAAVTEAVDVSVTDDDTQAVRLSVSTLNVLEGGTATFGVHLAFAPSAPLTVSINPASAAVATVDSPTLIFQAGDYAVDQLVTVYGTQDLDLISNSTTINCTAPGATAAALSVTMNDNDLQGFVVTPSPVVLTEGQSLNVTVRLAFQPATTTSVGVASSSAELTRAPASLTFTTANWSTPQTLTLTSVADTDAVNDTLTLTLSAAGVTSLAVPVTITDTTVVSQLGWPTAFSIAEVAPADQIRAYRITVPAGQTLDKLGLIAGVAGGDFSLALYTEAGAVPGTLVASTVRTTLSAAGMRDVELADTPIGAGSYYVAMRAEPSVSLLRSSSATARLCTRALANLATAWPASFGAATCSTNTPVNLFAVTFAQP